MITAAQAGNAGGAALGIVLWLAYVAAYFVPSIVALSRRGKANTGTIIVINFFLGWTVIGWIVALAMACRSRPQPPQYVVPPGWGPRGDDLG